jgi:hypothetical protein
VTDNGVETSREPLRLTLDADAEHASARLRLGAAVIALFAGGWLAWVAVGSSKWLGLVALASVAFALRWMLGYRKVKRATSAADAHYLEITSERLTVANGVEQRSIPRELIARIELDDDRLAVVLRLTSGEELTIEPIYGGLGLRDLGETLQRYLNPLRTRLDPGCTELNP